LKKPCVRAAYDETVKRKSTEVAEKQQRRGYGDPKPITIRVSENVPYLGSD